METAGLSTAIMLAVAALLWFLYFLPNWIRRREYLATERTAAQLQRTIRVLAESAELPEEVRIEANAREAARAERERLAREREIAEAALREAEAAAEERARIEQARARAKALRQGSAVPAPIRREQRLRRGRRIAGLVLLAALVVATVQFVLMALTGIAMGAWVVLGAAVIAGGSSIATQRWIRTQLRAEAPAAPAQSTPRPKPAASPAPAPAAPTVTRSWTPQPLPRPRYLEHPDAAPIGPSLGAPTMDAQTRLRIAAAAAAIEDPKVATLPQRTAAAAPAASATSSASAASAASTPTRSAGDSRFAAMGVLGDLTSPVDDLDAVLARRRKVS